jgi:hypothetical protein
MAIVSRAPAGPFGRIHQEMMMNKMTKLALAVATTAALGAAATLSYAKGGISLNGLLLSGIALQTLELNQPLITAVVLPSGETVDLRQQATAQAVRK